LGAGPDLPEEDVAPASPPVQKPDTMSELPDRSTCKQAGGPLGLVPRSTNRSPVAGRLQAVRSRAPGTLSDDHRNTVDRWLAICMPQPSSPSFSAASGETP